MPRNIFQHHLENQAGNRIKVAGKCFAPQTQGLQRINHRPQKDQQPEGSLRDGRLYNPRPTSRKVRSEERSQFEKSPMNFRSAFLKSSSFGPNCSQYLWEKFSRRSLEIFRAVRITRVWQQKPNSIARQAANGRLAHQRCSVHGCPCRIDFSLADASTPPQSENRLQQDVYILLGSKLLLCDFFKISKRGSQSSNWFYHSIKKKLLAPSQCPYKNYF